jgi:lipopolysaccharide cholinephosphotransferase
MQEMTKQEVQQVLLELLIDFSELCAENNLSYYLAYGTLLGAIRGGGFIPWDDDVDVWMPRPDYEIFKTLYFKKSHQKILEPNKDGSIWQYLKLIDRRTVFEEPLAKCPKDYGVFIDVFPLDGLPNAGTRKHYNRIVRMSKLFIYSYALNYQNELNCTLKGRIKAILGFFGRIRKKSDYTLTLDRRATRYSFEGSHFITSYFSLSPFNIENYEKQAFTGCVKTVFEGTGFSVPINSEKMLEQIYGKDWMTPIKQNSCDHGKAYWREPKVKESQ